MNNYFGNSFTTDDLLSTHPIVNDNTIYLNQELINNNNEEFKKKKHIHLLDKEKIIIVSSKDRNPYVETLNNFSIFFNTSDNNFERYPVYYNNPTIPQTYDQRIKGIKGDLNINGWKDKYNNIYPAYNPCDPPGEIISYDSIFISGNSKSSIMLKLNNIVSIKIEKLYVFEYRNNNNNENDTSETIKSQFINITLSNIKSNLITNFFNKEINDILLKDERFLGWWMSINNCEFKYYPPINNLGNIKINWNYGYNVNEDESNTIYENITTLKNGIHSIQDILIIYSFEIVNDLIILKTSPFSDFFWENLDLIQIKNIRSNVDYSFLDQDKKKNIEDLIYILSSNNHKILFTSLFLDLENQIDGTLESIQNNLNIKNRIIIQLPSVLKYQNISLTSEVFLTLNNSENQNIGNEKINIPYKDLLLSNIITQLNDSSKISELSELNNIDFKFLKTLRHEWVNNGPFIMNLSKQSLIVLKISYLDPIIQTEDKDNISIFES